MWILVAFLPFWTEVISEAKGLNLNTLVSSLTAAFAVILTFRSLLANADINNEHRAIAVKLRLYDSVLSVERTSHQRKWWKMYPHIEREITTRQIGSGYSENMEDHWVCRVVANKTWQHDAESCLDLSKPQRPGLQSALSDSQQPRQHVNIQKSNHFVSLLTKICPACCFFMSKTIVY